MPRNAPTISISPGRQPNDRQTRPHAPLGSLHPPAQRLASRHVGSLHAADSALALQAARDVYTRRGEGNSIWVCRSADIAASDPSFAEANFEPSDDKIYRHPSFYDIPDEVGHM